MDIDEFQQHALKSVALAKKDVAALAHRSLGLSGEAGIIANQIKKIIRDKSGQAEAQDLEILSQRLGDTLYYIAVLSEYFDLKLTDVAKQNMKRSTNFKEQRSND